MMKYILFILMSFGFCAVDAQSRIQNEADSLFTGYNYSAAASLYEQLTKGDDSVKTFRRLAQCYRKMGNYALESNTLSRIPEDSLSHTDMRQLYYSYSNMQDSLAMKSWGEKILKLYPTDGDITASVAADLMAVGNYVSAKLLTFNYLAKDSMNLNVLRQYAYSSYLLGDDDEALLSYQKLNKNGWNNYEVNFILGVCYSDKDEPARAVDYLTKTNQIKASKDATVLNLLAKNCLKIGMPLEAANYMEQAIRLMLPDSTTLSVLYNQLAESYFAVHNYDKAISAFQNASKYNPGNAITYYNIAQMYNGKKDAANLIKYYKLFLQHASTLSDNEENRELIEKVKQCVSNYAGR